MVWIHILLALLITPAFAGSPGFDCAKARTDVEQLICGDTDLSRLDAALRPTFERAYAAVDLKDALLAGQREWLARRHYCVSSTGGDDAAPRIACLRGRYERRLAFLRRPMTLTVTNLCHTLADAIASAGGYVPPKGSRPTEYPNYGSLDLAATDAMGAMTLNDLGFNELRRLTAEQRAFVGKLRTLEPKPDGNQTLHRIGRASNALLVAEYFQGAAYCQVSEAYRITPSGSLVKIKASIGTDDDCRGNYMHFADAPSGGSQENPAFLRLTTELSKNVISVRIWTGSKLSPICRLTANYDVALSLEGKACRDSRQCDDLSKQAFDLAEAFDQKHVQSDETAPVGETLAGTTSIEPSLNSDDHLKIERGWFTDGYNEANQYQTFASGAASFKSLKSDVMFKISHGTYFAAISDDYIIEAYADTADGLTPIAAFQIGKERTALHGPIDVMDMSTGVH